MNSPVLKVIAWATIFVSLGCTDRNDIMTSNAERPSNPVRMDSDRFAAASQAERQAAESAAIGRILDRLPASDRAKARELLETKDGGMNLVSSTDPEIARDMSIIASARAASAAEQARQLQRDEAATSGTEHIRVLVALVAELPVNGPRAVVERRPDDDGIPLLMLREDATPDDLLSGMRVAARSVRTHGRVPNTRRQMVIDRASASAPESITAYLSLLREARMREIEGIGTVRAMIVRTEPDRSESRARRGQD